MALQQGAWPPSVPISSLPARGRAVCAGVIDSVTIMPADRPPEFSAIVTDHELPGILTDGLNHRVRLVWIGRRRVPGILAGTRLRFEGMVSQRAGLPTIYNPRYEIIGTQES